MRPSKFNEGQIHQALSQVGAGTPLAAMCRKLGVTPTTFYRWRRKYGNNDATVTHDARALRDENQKLKQLVADLYLERQRLRESLAKHSKGARHSND